MILSVAPLGLTACPSFAVGPDAYPLVETDDDVCEAAELGAAPCSGLDVDNGVIFDEDLPQPVLFSMGFVSNERNLDYVTVSYERPGHPVREEICGFGLYPANPQGDAELRCYSATLAGTFDTTISPVSSAAEGVLSIDLDILADEPGTHALSAWLTDANGYDSPTVRWQFVVQQPERE